VARPQVSDARDALTPIREIDYRALRYLMERTEGSALKKRLALERFDKAWRLGELVIPLEETAFQKWVRCEARFLLGDYSDWSGWQYRSEFAQRCWFENPFKCPVWAGDRVKRLGVVGEQGIGDEILFASVIPDLLERVDSVTLEAEARLVPIFERSFGINCVPAVFKEKEGYEGLQRVLHEPQEYGADAWVTMADTPRIFRKKDSDFHRRAYLKADPKQVERFRHLNGRIGISWRGAQGEYRWQDVVKLYPNAISLQYDQTWEEDVERPEVDLKNDLEGILGVLSNLEKVVTVSTSVAHMAAALGTKTEVFIAKVGTGRRSHLTPWKWINRKHPGQSLWYPPTVKTHEQHNWKHPR
jgi:hypothetical protein